MTNIKSIIYFLLAVCTISFTACTVEEQGWADPRYLDNFEIYVYHTNPKTGVDYTDEELASLSYDPRLKESYSEGQAIDLALVTAKRPKQVQVLSGRDLSVLETLTEFSTSGDQFRSNSFVRSLADLGLSEVGDKMTLKFAVDYEDGSIGSAYFDIKRIKFIDPSTVIDYFVYLKKSTGELMGLLTDDNVTSREKNPEVGTIVTFDGVNNKVEITNVPDLNFRNTADFSVGLWVNTTATNSDPSIIGDKDWGSGGNPGFVFAFRGDDWKLNAGDGSNRIDIDGAVINDGNWHFLVATFDRDGNATIYQDGISIGSTDMSGIGDMSSGNPIHLAQDGTGGYGDWFEGQIGEVFIYDYVLSSEEVASASSVKTGVQLRKQDGTIQNIAVTTAGGVGTSVEEDRFAFTLDGTDDYVSCANNNLDFRYTDDFTIAVWVNTTATNSDPSIIGDKDWGSGGNPGFVFAFLGGNWKLNAGDGSNRIDLSGGTINDGEWHLLACTFDRDGKATLYQDGVVQESTNMTDLTESMDSGFPIRLGQDGTGSYGEWFGGKVANSMIFDYVLSTEEMDALFKG